VTKTSGKEKEKKREEKKRKRKKKKFKMPPRKRKINPVEESSKSAKESKVEDEVREIPQSKKDDIIAEVTGADKIAEMRLLLERKKRDLEELKERKALEAELAEIEEERAQCKKRCLAVILVPLFLCEFDICFVIFIVGCDAAYVSGKPVVKSRTQRACIRKGKRNCGKNCCCGC